MQQLISEFSNHAQQVSYPLWHFLFLLFWGGETLAVLNLNRARQSGAI